MSSIAMLDSGHPLSLLLRHDMCSRKTILAYQIAIKFSYSVAAIKKVTIRHATSTDAICDRRNTFAYDAGKSSIISRAFVAFTPGFIDVERFSRGKGNGRGKRWGRWPIDSLASRVILAGRSMTARPADRRVIWKLFLGDLPAYLSSTLTPITYTAAAHTHTHTHCSARRRRRVFGASFCRPARGGRIDGWAAGRVSRRQIGSHWSAGVGHRPPANKNRCRVASQYVVRL